MPGNEPSRTIVKVAAGFLKQGLKATVGEPATELLTAAFVEPGADRITGWLQSHEGQAELRKARERADRWFGIYCREPYLRDRMPLMLGELPAVQEAIAALPTDFDERNIVAALRRGIAGAFPALEDEQIESAAELYWRCLGEALAPLEGFAERLRGQLQQQATEGEAPYKG